MKPITSTSEKLVEGVNYYTRKETTWNGIEWISYNAKIGNSRLSCTSLEDLQYRISNYKFETAESRLLMERAVASFGTNA
ncbi:hypothetical protein [Polaribacter aestuariivivens]|uniref:hypothetical protein n=1 Tax=Polaribacter aestuariivivens TaxID=2304626 RepID=UPI003F497347